MGERFFDPEIVQKEATEWDTRRARDLLHFGTAQQDLVGLLLTDRLASWEQFVEYFPGLARYTETEQERLKLYYERFVALQDQSVKQHKALAEKARLLKVDASPEKALGQLLFAQLRAGVAGNGVVAERKGPVYTLEVEDQSQIDALKLAFGGEIAQEEVLDGLCYPDLQIYLGDGSTIDGPDDWVHLPVIVQTKDKNSQSDSNDVFRHELQHLLYSKVFRQNEEGPDSHVQLPEEAKFVRDELLAFITDGTPPDGIRSNIMGWGYAEKWGRLADGDVQRLRKIVEDITDALGECDATELISRERLTYSLLHVPTEEMPQAIRAMVRDMSERFSL